MKYTMQDVANEAKVSIATVSRILNGQEGYSPETKQRVMEVIKRMDYRVNSVARGLVTKKSLTIGVMLPNLVTGFASDILSGIEDYAHAKGYSVIICNTGTLGARAEEYIELLAARQVDGMINISINMREEAYALIDKLGIPCVLIAMDSKNYPFPSVRIDDMQAAYSATEYLIQKGHTKIAMLGAHLLDAVTGQPREQGYKQALIDHGIEVNDALIQRVGYSYEEGLQGIEALLEKMEPFTAIFTMSDHLAVAAIQIIQERGLKVPDDIAVIGFDDTLVAKMYTPPLTTLGQPLYEIGHVACKKVLQLIDGVPQVGNAVLPHHIVERKTV